MTRSTVKTFSSRTLQLATLFLAASMAFGGEPGASNKGKQAQPAGSVVVPAPHQVPLIGTMVITAKPSRAVLVTDLGSMTVTATRDVLVADLGTMTVTAQRQDMLVADLGAMTVTARRELVFARN
jgi:hypothetical protein